MQWGQMRTSTWRGVQVWPQRRHFSWGGSFIIPMGLLIRQTSGNVNAVNHLSLFTGIGGFDLGFEAAGFETVAQVEYDRFCNSILEARWPNTPRGRDIADYHPDHQPAVVTFGSPCQDLSVAGRRAGLDGARSGLFFEACRVIEECRPTFAVWENVPGAFSSNRGRDFRAVLVALEQLGATDIAWRVFDSQYAGVPQQRRRIYLVADFGGRRAAEVLFEPEGCGGHPAPGGEEGEGVAHTIRGRSHGAGRRRDNLSDNLVSKPLGSNATGGFRFDLDHDTYVSAPVVSKWAKGSGGPAGDEIYNLAPPITSNPRNRSNSLGPLAIRTAQTSANGHGVSAQAHALDSQVEAVAFVQNSRSEVREMRVPGAVALGGAQQTHYAKTATAIRRFTPVECERLQGFPDGWTCLCGAAGDMFACRCSDGPRYRALGNAATVTVPAWIARRLAAVVS